MSTIFISYRRDDSEGQTGRLFDDLVEHFGKDSVFIDVAGIDKGRDFRKIIERYISSCQVVLVVIGKNWMESRDEHGQRRIDKEGDYVRYETSVALSRDIPVIPVLISNTPMPRADQLPPSISELAFRNGVELSHTRWASDVKLLINALSPYIDEQPTQEPINSSDRLPWIWKILATASVIGIAVLLGAIYSIHRSKAQPVLAQVAATAPQAGAEIVTKPPIGFQIQESTPVIADLAQKPVKYISPPNSMPMPSASSNLQIGNGTASVANKPTPEGTMSKFIYKEPCGAITDVYLSLQWIVGPDQDTTWSDAKSWADSLSLCGGNWSLPTVNDLKALYDPTKSAGKGFYSAQKYWPARINPIFDGIGDGSWVWANETVDSNKAKAVNLNQGVPVTFEKSQTQYPVRAFAVRQLKKTTK
jgi:hypothetical protein